MWRRYSALLNNAKAPVQFIFYGRVRRYFKDRLARLEANGVRITKQAHRFGFNNLQHILSDNEVNHGLAIVVCSAGKVLQVRRTLHQLGFDNSKITDEHLTM